MTTTYRLVHFTPDPFIGARFPLGAIVVDASGVVRVAKVRTLPSACPGDRRLVVAVQRVQARLEALTTADELPAVFGPYTTLAEACAVPARVTDPLNWVEAMLNPPPSPNRRFVAPHGAHRASLGFRFFETWRVDRYVHKTFHPSSDWEGRLERHAAGLPELSHWVGGRDEVLLMEPVVPTRSHFEHELKEVAVKIGAYRYALEDADAGSHGHLTVYLTAGGHPDRRASARDALAPFAHAVVDTDDEGQRIAFIERIRSVGSEADSQAVLVPEG